MTWFPPLYKVKYLWLDANPKNLFSSPMSNWISLIFTPFLNSSLANFVDDKDPWTCGKLLCFQVLYSLWFASSSPIPIDVILGQGHKTPIVVDHFSILESIIYDRETIMLCRRKCFHNCTNTRYPKNRTKGPIMASRGIKCCIKHSGCSSKNGISLIWTCSW